MTESPFTDEELREFHRELDARRPPGTYEPEKWSVSPHNRRPEAVGKAFPPYVQVRDITVRTIVQAHGVTVDGDQRRRIAEALAEALVPSIQLTYAVTSREDLRPLVEHIRKIRPETEIALEGVHNRALIDRAAEAGVDLVQFQGQAISALTPMHRSEVYDLAWRGDDWRTRPHLRARTDEELISVVQEQVRYANDQGLRTSAGINRLSYATPGFVDRFCREVALARPRYITLYDSTSGMGPRAWSYIASIAKAAAPECVLAVHTHNHFGLAVAGALDAVQAGAEVVETSVNGLSDEAGQADLAEVVVALEVLYGVNTGIRLESLTGLRRLVEDISGVKMAQTKPITGEYAWAIAGEYLIWEENFDHLYHSPLDPSLVGNRRMTTINEFAKNWAMLTKLEEVGVRVARERVPEILDTVLREMRLRRRALDDEEIAGLALSAGGTPTR